MSSPLMLPSQERALLLALGAIILFAVGLLSASPDSGHDDLWAPHEVSQTEYLGPQINVGTVWDNQIDIYEWASAGSDSYAGSYVWVTRVANSWGWRYRESSGQKQQ